MIDYIKLKEAHELAHKYSEQSDTLVGIEIFFQPRREFHYRVSMQAGDSMTSTPIGIDDLITKLKELTQSKPKYEMGDIVWLFNYECNEIDCFKIDAITKKNLTYSGKCINSEFVYEEIPEKDLYPFREALIDAQIEYWQSLKEPVKPEDMRPKFEGEPISFRCFDDEMEVGKCKHESDGISYGAADYGAIAHSRCKKCGEFYR